MPFKRLMCLLCGYIYDEEKGWPEDGIAPGTRWDDVPPPGNARNAALPKTILR